MSRDRIFKVTINSGQPIISLTASSGLNILFASDLEWHPPEPKSQGALRDVLSFCCSRKDIFDLVHRLIAHLKIPRSQFSDGKWTSGNGYSWRGTFFSLLASKMCKGMTRILFKTGMPFVHVTSAYIGALFILYRIAWCIGLLGCKRRGSVSAERYYVVENLSNGYEAILVGLSRSHHCSSVHSVPQVFFINLNLRTITAK